MRGAVGTVVAGRFRDLQEHRSLGYPVRTYDYTILFASKVADAIIPQVFATDIGTASPYETVHVSAVSFTLSNTLNFH